MDNSHYEKCPCWSVEGNRQCSLTEEGVYLPLPKHIIMFCQSSNYMHCIQYIRGHELSMSKDVAERRRIRRYYRNIYMDIVVCDVKNNSSVKSKYKVRTLDVSLYGMKIESPEKVTTDTIVGFEFDHDFSSDSLAGAGTVKWCEQQVDSDKFEFGMAFSDDTVMQKGFNKLLSL